jgi:hypothetical protein
MKLPLKPILVLILLVSLGFVLTNYLAVGVTTLSFDKVQFSGHDDILNDEVWTIHFVQGGLAQRYIGFMASNTKETDGDKRTKKPFTLDITNTRQFCEYPIDVDTYAVPINVVQYKEMGVTRPTTQECASKYAGDAKNVLSIYKPPFSFHYICVYEVPQTSHIATFNDNSLKFTTDFKMGIGSDTYKQTISTTNIDDTPIKTTVKFNDVAYITWVGNLNTGDNCPSPADKRVAAYFDNKWNILNAARYDTYKNYYQSHFPLESTPSTNELELMIAKNNQRAYSALWIDDFASGKALGDENNGKVIVELDNIIQLPSFVAYISADDIVGLGVYQPVAKPKIVSVGPITFKSGNIGRVPVVIQNIGGGRGGFYTSIECDNYVSLVGSPIYKRLDAGEIASFSIRVSGGGDTRKDASCRVGVEVLGETVYSDPFTVTVDPQQVCTPNIKTCDGDTAKICKSDGSGWIIEDSDRCLGNGDGDDNGDGIVDGLLSWFKNTTGLGDTGGLTGILYGLVIILFGLVGLLMAYGIVKEVLVRWILGR